MSKELEIFGVSVRVSFLAFILFVGISAAGYAVYPYFADMETRGTRHTLQYITTHQTALRTIYSQYEDRTLGVAHRRALFAQMRQEADFIPHDVPADIQNSLSNGFQE